LSIILDPAQEKLLQSNGFGDSGFVPLWKDTPPKQTTALLRIRTDNFLFFPNK